MNILTISGLMFIVSSIFLRCQYKHFLFKNRRQDVIWEKERLSLQYKIENYIRIASNINLVIGIAFLIVGIS